MRTTAAAALVLAFSVPVASAQEVVEPRSGARFAESQDGMSLLGVGLRTKTFLKVKVYAVGLYVADAALAGPLAAHRGKTRTPAFYRDVVTGDFPKQITMKFVRDLSDDQIQEAFREALGAADAGKVHLFVNYFPDLKSGDEATLRWAPGGTLQTRVAGLGRPPIADRRFAEAVFRIWLGENPIQDDVKKDLVSRAEALLK